jgi:hypothetical protein
MEIDSARNHYKTNWEKWFVCILKEHKVAEIVIASQKTEGTTFVPAIIASVRVR